MEAHECGRRPQAQRHLTFLTDAVTSHAKTPVPAEAQNLQGKEPATVDFCRFKVPALKRPKSSFADWCSFFMPRGSVCGFHIQSGFQPLLYMPRGSAPIVPCGSAFRICLRQIHGSRRRAGARDDRTSPNRKRTGKNTRPIKLTFVVNYFLAKKSLT